ncbi:MAG: glycolate oxidase subunit GlcE [Methylococcaceae bacterium]|nr:glycolate oxidase subunit GlcE [Methylococcaceae bacterium]
MADFSADLQSAVRDAIARANPLCIQGGGGKSFYGRKARGLILNVSEHSGILHYEASELVITARCGTPLEVIEMSLAEQGQMLGFEPPRFGSHPTLGGAVASGLSGPRRPFSGSVRDFVLGCRIINGLGEILSFGGEAMKNVAGYDLSRLMAGSLGTLAVILDISLKVIPRPEMELTLRQEMNESQAIEKMNRWMGQALPISALAWHRGLGYIRLSGGRRALTAASRILGGEQIENELAFWSLLRDQKLPFFREPGSLWRLSLESAAPHIELSGDWFYEWGGAQRWFVSQDSAQSLFNTASQYGGHATLFRADANRQSVFQPLSEDVARIHRRVKKAFDPHGIFNPGRMYSEW